MKSSIDILASFNRSSLVFKSVKSPAAKASIRCTWVL